MDFIDAHPWVVQLVAPVLLVVSAVLVYRQLKSNRRHQRRDQYLATTVLPEDFLRAAKLHWRDHFSEEVYVRRYQNDDRRISSYLLMVRKYYYLLYQHGFRDALSASCDRWIIELAAYQEFRDVHEANGKYYPGFRRKVGRVIKATDSKGWYYEQPAPSDVRREVSGDAS